MLRMLLSCVLALSHLFPTMFKSSLFHGNGPLHFVVCQWCDMPFTLNFRENTRKQ